MGDAVLIEQRGPIRILRLNRPEARNAMDTRLLTDLVEALHDAGSDDGVRGVCLTGEGGTFSAGADVREELADGGTRRMELFGAMYESLSMHPKPTAAAIEGAAVGGGVEAAAACDIRVAGRSAIVRFPGAGFGVPVGAARTTGLVGRGTAKDWVLSCRDVGAEEALRAGFHQRLVDDGGAETAALRWLDLVATRDPATVARLKNAFNVMDGLPDRVAWENDAIRSQRETEDLEPFSPGGFGMPGAARDA